MLWPKNPAIQVQIATHNVRPYIESTLSSIEESLEGQNWILIIADDGSFDGTVEYLNEYKTSANKYLFKSFKRANYLGEAKNRAVKMGEKFRKSHPAIFIMDGDDLMVKNRVTKLLPFAVENQYPLVIGSHIRLGYYGDNEIYYKAHDNSNWMIESGIWATVFHESLIPKDSKLFREDTLGFDDGLLFSKWLKDGFHAKPLDTLVHIYLRRDNTVYNIPDKSLDFDVKKKYQDCQFEYFFGRERARTAKNSSFYFIFKESDSLDSFMSKLSGVVYLTKDFPNIEFIIVDSSKDFRLTAACQWSMVRELSFGSLKVISNNEDFKSITNDILKKSDGEKIVYSEIDKINYFAVSAINEEKVATVSSRIKNFMIFNRKFYETKHAFTKNQI